MASSRVEPLVRRALVSALEAAARARFRIEVRGVEHFTGSPATLVVANHRRDADLPILGDVLYGRLGPLGANGPPHFVAREDLFRTGFLADYLRDLPAPLRALLGPVNLGPVLELLHAHPMRRIPELSLGEVLEHALAATGDRPLSEVLKPEVVANLERLAPAGNGPLLVSQALGRRYRRALRRPGGLKALTRDAFMSLKPYEKGVIRRQLDTFVALLDAGETVHVEPEGVISEDGSFARVRGAIHTLLNAPVREVRVLPVCITYDFMMVGRQRVFVNVGPEILGLRGRSPAETSELVSGAILAEAMVTASQLATHRLALARSRGGAIVTRSELERYVAREAVRCATAGAMVDGRLLADRPRERRLESYLRFCLRERMLAARDDGTFRIVGAGQSPLHSRADGQTAIGYMEHELSSLDKVWHVVS